MKLYLATFLLTLCALFIHGCSEVTTADGRGPSVGFNRFEFHDASRSNWADTGPRPLVTYIWYPAESSSEMRKFGIPPDKPVFIAGNAAWQAAFFEAGQRYPLIIMSHGTGGAGMQMMWLGRELAANGFIAIAVDHHGNTAAEDAYDPRGFRLPWERALDLSAAIDLLLDDPTFGPRIDSRRIGAVGYSLGGYSVIALAGGITDLSKFEAFCASDARDATCNPQSEFPEAESEFQKLSGTDRLTFESLSRHANSFRDDRIKSFVVLAPALVQAFSTESLNDIQAPFLIIAGSGDTIAPHDTNADTLSNMLPRAQTKLLDKAGHYVFLSECTLKGRLFVSVCSDPIGVNRSRIHKEVSSTVGRYFLSTL